MKLKSKHWRIANHYARFVDSNWFPNFKVTKEVVEAFIKYESEGVSRLTGNERELISPLVGESYKPGKVAHELTGKPSYELLKKQIHEEIFDWWCKGWGWSPPISSNIDYEFKNRHRIKNDTFLRELIEIKRKLRGFSKNWQNDILMERRFVKPEFSAKISDPVINYLVSLDGSVFSRGEINTILDKKTASNSQILKEIR